MAGAGSGILPASALLAFALITAPASLAQTPAEYTCVFPRNVALLMRLSPDHVAVQRAGKWSNNACTEGRTTCSADAQGRLQIVGQSMVSSIGGDLLFDPASGELTVTIGPPDQRTTLTGQCSIPAQGLS